MPIMDLASQRMGDGNNGKLMLVVTGEEEEIVVVHSDNESGSSGHGLSGQFVPLSIYNVTEEHFVSTALIEVSKELRIPLYSIIFLLGVLGNSLVIVTLTRNRHMLTVTNVHLLNLAVSDLLLGVFCMPFTLVGSVLREFIFGEIMCKIIPYLQAVSVSVSVWTLVAISLERYFAICEPLHSRRWQTLSHAYKTIIVLWFLSVVSMLPVLVLSRLQPTKNSGRYKCREKWPTDQLEKLFNLFLDLVLLVAPLIIMTVAYSKVTYSLWQGIRLERQNTDNVASVLKAAKDSSTQSPSVSLSGTGYSVGGGIKASSATLTIRWTSSSRSSASSTSSSSSSLSTCDCVVQKTNTGDPPIALNSCRIRRLIRSTNHEKSLVAKKRVIRMLFVVVLEFFVCWTPLYVINTWSLFDATAVYGGLGPTGISFFHLLAYVSSCCNPITYCFMNNKFRHGFLQTFGCSKWRRFARHHRGGGACWSHQNNSSTANGGGGGYGGCGGAASGVSFLNVSCMHSTTTTCRGSGETINLTHTTWPRSKSSLANGGSPLLAMEE